ncbi:hypothetical protein BEL04_04600 [Mucilaginibacter sp. PPCGB 2223]|uniref:TlpA disulfide reductase family protein n=1 Tax=Mucilaginibacter sp. PPCGB 2223 TaxID=1886027 RepID=UPI00082428B1|nr:TlpA disulfide reductase family protein [Mucilaginibacter sp. PPCGB 2223]OCX53578.1 hypothetical protein BEL04_04600 [Mucilaginibacter sp. PPCGB 2223]
MRVKSLACLAVVFCAVTSITSCKDNDNFILKGLVDNPGKIKTAYLLAPDTALSYSMTTVDSAALSDGRFSFKRQAFFPTFYKVLLGSHTYDIIAKNGDEISFKLNGKDTTYTYEISGSDDSENMYKLNKMSNYFAAITTKLTNEYGAKAKQAKNKADSDALYKLYYPKFIQNMDDYGAKTLAFIDSNKNSLAAFYASKTLDKYKYEQKLVAYADVVKDKFAGNKDVQNFVKEMEAVKPLSVGHAAPEFTLLDFDGKPVKLSDYKGKYLMVDFWASWCMPCRQENPNVVKQYARFKDKGLNILGVSLDNNKKDWAKAVAADKITWRQAGDLKRFDGATEKLYKIEAIPSNFIIDPNGIIVAKNITGTDLEVFLNKTFNKPQ